MAPTSPSSGRDHAEPPPRAPETPLEAGLLLWRRRFLDATAGTGVVLVLWPFLAHWTPSLSPFLLGLAVLLACAALVSVVLLWRRLYQFAREAGGPWYATGQLLASVALTPIFLLGVLAVPLLVRQDARRGFAAWRGATAMPLPERLMRSMVALLVLGLGWLLAAAVREDAAWLLRFSALPAAFLASRFVFGPRTWLLGWDALRLPTRAE